MKIQYIILFYIPFLLLSCKKKDETPVNIESNLPELTGITFHDYEGNSIGSYGGEVNNNIGYKDINDINNKYLLIFPNPAEDVITLYGFGIDTTVIRNRWMAIIYSLM